MGIRAFNNELHIPLPTPGTIKQGFCEGALVHTRIVEFL
jgi:hypothetical protein